MNRPVKLWAVLAMVCGLYGLSGCVSVGIECKTERVNAWAKKRTIVPWITQRQAQAIAVFRREVCQ